MKDMVRGDAAGSLETNSGWCDMRNALSKADRRKCAEQAYTVDELLQKYEELK